jgi:hypothetical protein
VVGTAPPFSQAAIGQASACVAEVTGAAIGNTACILFNSRGIPVNANGAPPAVGAPRSDALYVTDGLAVYGETISATGLIKLWRTNPTATPNWILQ